MGTSGAPNPAQACCCRPAGLPEGHAGAAVLSYRSPRLKGCGRDAAGEAGPCLGAARYPHGRNYPGLGASPAPSALLAHLKSQPAAPGVQTRLPRAPWSCRPAASSSSFSQPYSPSPHGLARPHTQLEDSIWGRVSVTGAHPGDRDALGVAAAWCSLLLRMMPGICGGMGLRVIEVQPWGAGGLLSPLLCGPPQRPGRCVPQ